MSNQDDEPTGMHDIFEAVEAAIVGADPVKREALAKTLDAFAEDSPDAFFWAVGPQAPALLHQLMMTIDVACRSQPKARRLIDRKPAGSA